MPASIPHAPVSAATVCGAAIDKRKSQLENILPMLIICKQLVFFMHLAAI
jgi:hypothetical protein